MIFAARLNIYFVVVKFLLCTLHRTYKWHSSFCSRNFPIDLELPIKHQFNTLQMKTSESVIRKGGYIKKVSKNKSLGSKARLGSA